jgi:hypothetical protein
MAAKTLTDELGPRPRTLHLVDVENLMGGPNFTAAAAATVKAHYDRLSGISGEDHVIIASSHHAAPGAWLGWPCGRRLVRSGLNGADLALIDVIKSENPSARYDRVVIGSGDWAFADCSARLHLDGCAVTVVARCPASVSRRLRLAAPDIRYLNANEVAAVVDLSRKAA